MKIITHRLMRISLVNWYLFESDDLDINGESIMLTGSNGAGKSTILDAIQTILAGADENKLMYNAASSDGRSSGRSIRSYALGEVTEDSGSNEKCEPRQVANTYISLCFQKPNGAYYSFGCAFYARQDRSSIDKYLFLIDGYALSASDFLQDQSVLPFKDFQQRLASMPGKATVSATSTEFRDQACVMMSAMGAHAAISPDVLFRTISQGLRFQPQKNVTEFIRNHILPSKNIDVVRIENDYRQYKDILKDIQNAKDRLVRFNAIIKHFDAYKSHSIKSVACEWASREAQVCKADLRLESLEEQRDTTLTEQRHEDTQCAELEDKLTKLASTRDQALTDKNDSDLAAKIALYRERLDRVNTDIKPLTTILNECRRSLSAIEAIPLSNGIDAANRTELQTVINDIQACTAFAKEDVFNTWPQSEATLKHTFAAVEKLATPLTSLTQRVSDLDRKNSEYQSTIQYLTDVHKTLKAGQASLKPQTQAVIQLLKAHDIQASPVCDMAEISDGEWQEGVERFLGVWNREALLIVNPDGEPVDTPTLERALAIYRREKNTNPRLRAVKLLNPGKIRTPKNTPKSGTAAALIESDNVVVRNYLQGLLYDVELVNTEGELRQCHRGITKDGMTAANGTISGGNTIEFILFGQAARQSQAEKLHQDLVNTLQEHTKVKDLLGPLKDISNELSRHKTELLKQQDQTIASFSTLQQLKKDAQHFQDLIKELEADDSFAALERRFIAADKACTECRSAMATAQQRRGELRMQLQEIERSIPPLKEEIGKAATARATIESQPFFDQQASSAMFEQLAEKYNEDFDTIQNDAFAKARNQERKATEAKENANLELSELVHRHDLEDKTELVALPPLDALSRCREYADAIEKSEIAVHEHIAAETREMMIQHFRSEIASKLKDNMTGLQGTFDTLNSALTHLHFNNTRFKFTSQLVEIDTLKDVYAYVTLPDESHIPGGLFDDAQDHPGLTIIEEVITDGRLHEIADYRNFFSFDIQTIDTETGAKRRFSDLLKTGSGGEQQSPFYVALGASFMNAYKLRKQGDSGVIGGASLAIFDEAMSKMDSVNTAAALQFFQSLGLQIILAAPPEASVKIAPHIDRTITVIRANSQVFLDNHRHTDAAKLLLESDNPIIHPELANTFMAAVEQEFGR